MDALPDRVMTRAAHRLYLAYGSNLHPLRLTARVPSARLVGVVPIDGARVSYTKRGMDGSGKCTLDLAAAGNQAWGAVYELRASEQVRLDQFEGRGRGYEIERLKVHLPDGPVDVFTYVAAATHVMSGLRPFGWYRDLVVAGARYHAYASEYIAALENVSTDVDPDPERRALHERLLAELAAASTG